MQLQIVFSMMRSVLAIQNLVACYQLAQSILKVGSVLYAKEWDSRRWVGGLRYVQVSSTWQLPWLAVERSRLALAGPLPF